MHYEDIDSFELQGLHCTPSEWSAVEFRLRSGDQRFRAWEWFNALRLMLAGRKAPAARLMDSLNPFNAYGVIKGRIDASAFPTPKALNGPKDH